MHSHENDYIMSTFRFNLQPEHLEDELIKIIPLQESDFEMLYKVASDPEIWKNHPTKNRYQKEVFKQFFDSGVASNSAFLIYDKLSGALIGSTRFYDFDPVNATIVIGFTFLAKKYWGGKYNRAMKQLLIDYAFQHVSTVLFHIGESNIISQKAVAKIGATKVGSIDSSNRTEPYYEYRIQKEDWL